MERGPSLDVDAVDDDTEFDYQPAPDPALGQPQVSSAIAIIRIVSVLAMGLFVAFGLFLMLFGGTALLIGAGLILLAIPCYFGMQLAERLAAQSQDS